MLLKTLAFLALLAVPRVEPAAQPAPATISVRISHFDLSRGESDGFAQAVLTGLFADSLLRPVYRPPAGSPPAAYMAEFEVARYSLDARVGGRDGSYTFTFAVTDNRSSQVVARDSVTVRPGESLAAAATEHARALARAIPR